MVYPCLVVCGSWRCDVDGEWEFLLDKGRLPKNVLVAESVQLSVLCDILVAEFGEPEIMASRVGLSYMKDSPVDGEEVPVFIKTNGGLGKFMKIFACDRNKSLFITFNDSPCSVPLDLAASSSKRHRTDVEPYVPEMVFPGNEQNFDVGTTPVVKRRNIVEPYIPEVVNVGEQGPIYEPNDIDNQMGDPYVHEVDISPQETNDIVNESLGVQYINPPVTRMSNVVDPYVPEVDNSVQQGPLLETNDIVNETIVDPFITPPVTRRRNVVDAILAPTFDLNEVWFDEEDLDVHNFLKEVEAIEEGIKSSGKKKGKQPYFEDVVEVESDEGDDGSDDEEIDVRPRGYDTEFWDSFIEEEFGGSDAVEVMCDTTDAFVPGVEPEFFINTEGNGHESNNGCKKATPKSGSHSQRSTAGSSSNVAGDKKDLSEDEEVDIPPLFDDTTYKVDEIPDLDNGDEDIWLGKTFANKSDCRITLAIYAIKNMFYFKQTRTRKDYFVAHCADPKCDWMVKAIQVKNSCYYKIKKASLEHTCSLETRSLYKKKATYKVIASVYRDKFNNKENRLKPKDVQQFVLEDMRISTSYSKCWRVKEAGNEELRGSDEESFMKLPEYLYVLKLANLDTIVDIEMVTDIDSGCERFLYAFLAFKASINGLEHLRPVIVLDGTHLHGKYKGVLLTASGQDANFQVFPLAFVVVDIEDDDSWSWFLTKLKSHIIDDSKGLSFISDRHQSIIKAKSNVYPHARHGACVIHLARNISGQFKSKGLGNLMIRAACAYKVSDFKDVLTEIDVRNSKCAKFLEELGYGTWSRAYFLGNRYNMMTSNIAESLNNALKKGRDLAITELIMFIQVMLTRWFSERRTKTETHRGVLTPEVEKLIRRNLEFAKGNTVAKIDTWVYAVNVRFGRPYTINLRDRGCTCRRFNHLHIPCSHALLAADKAKVSYGCLAAECYKSTVWQKTYAGNIHPHLDPRDVDIPEEIRSRVLLPPKTKRPPGRPRGKRLPSYGEISGKKTANKCRRCGGTGHNKTSCKNPI